MRGLTMSCSLRTIAAGHALLQNLRRGHYELARDWSPAIVHESHSANLTTRHQRSPGRPQRGYVPCQLGWYSPRWTDRLNAWASQCPDWHPSSVRARHHDPPPPPPPPPPENPPPENPPPENPLDPLPPEEAEWVAIQSLVVVAKWWMCEK
jgi:hypothetical protein